MLTSIIEQYKHIQSNVDRLIEQSGYRLGYVSNKLGMDKTSFYLKRKNANFTVDEIERLLSIIRADELEDKALAELFTEDRKSGIISKDEKQKLLNAS
ncbi:MAG: hypothetical protein AAF673_00475 [Pseudomonadota bacterium]